MVCELGGLCRLQAAWTWRRKSGGDSVREEEDPEDEVRLVVAVSPALGNVMLLPAVGVLSAAGGRRKLSLLSISGGAGGGGAHRHLAGQADTRVSELEKAAAAREVAAGDAQKRKLPGALGACWSGADAAAAMGRELKRIVATSECAWGRREWGENPQNFEMEAKRKQKTQIGRAHV